MGAIEILPDLFRFDDDCAVYLLRRGDRAIAIDYGSGRWLEELLRLRLPSPAGPVSPGETPGRSGGVERHGAVEFPAVRRDEGDGR